MADEKFVDGIGNIGITGMVVRFDMLALDPSIRDKEGQPTSVLRQRVVMPIDGFVRAVEKLNATLPQLEKMGVLKRKTNGEAGEVDTLAAALGSKDDPATETSKQ